MKTESELKSIVREKYTSIANQPAGINAASCCGATTSSEEVCNVMSEDYTTLEGYVEDADLGLGCGLPTQFARIDKGDVVIDLGSGAGNDCFVARHETGPEGKVIGIDFTPAMIEKARTNAEKMNFNNVEFREGDIDNMPVNDDVADVIVSNCVLNLVPNKPQVMQEIYRTLKPGGHFSISDIVLKGELPEALQEDAEMYAGCVAGAIQKDMYINAIRDAGFDHIEVQRERPIHIPKDILAKYLNEEEIETFNAGKMGIYSVSVYGVKPGEEKPEAVSEASEPCCEPGCC